ncbi:DUF3489 domain-containing protein [Defluviimonas salinarum]|uniref:DUF3489 domain-containing protein n=1 Tax=Defluviimonas salinarum TaxID=2992147 RepID=A0ABT3IY44_9RHOB|nr:DUF3489 domain-containing protein [Defluviimonas salinarum]MCW3780364.1 DUF3489 domain-containing protein [Defluviimonas salinarum]
MARKSKSTAATTPPPSKTAILVALLSRPEGATLDDLVRATKWQAHSVRGALAGSLRKRGHLVVSEKTEGVRRYRIAAAG